MELKQARTAAQALLMEILRTQPQLFTNQTGSHISSGQGVASFCREFIEEYAKYLSTTAD